MRRSDDWKPTFWVVGSMAVTLGVLLATFVLLFRGTVLHSRHVDIVRAWPLAVWLLVAGLGTARCSKWGSLLLCIPSVAVVVWWFGAMVVLRMWVFAAMAVSMAPLFLAPAVLTFRHWRELRTW